MTDLWTNQLSEYLDGELAADARDALEHHLEGCAECREVPGLRRLVARARALEDRTPDRDLWPGIAERIGASRRASRASPLPAFPAVRLLPAPARGRGIALVTVSGGSVWLLRPAAMGPPRRPAGARRDGDPAPGRHRRHSRGREL
jgi:anti-sigma factor RsiW